MKFRTTLLQSGKSAVGIQVPDEVVTSLGAGKRPPVRVTINGYTYRNTIAVMGGAFMVGVSAEHREKAHVAGGDEVEVDIELDTQQRELALPDDFRHLLEAEPEAKHYFEGLSYSRKQALVLPIAQAKTAETRQRRIERALATLREGGAEPKRPKGASPSAA
jgi:hypothetical protein